MLKSEVENVMEAEIGGVVMEIGAFVAMRNLLGVSDFVAAVCKWGRQHRRSTKVIAFGVKTQGLTLIGCVWQWPC